MASRQGKDASSDIDNFGMAINQHFKLVFQVSCASNLGDARLSFSPKKQKDESFLIAWTNRHLEGVIDHLQTVAQQLFFPRCSNKGDIMLLYKRLVLCSDQILEALLPSLKYPNNILCITCVYTGEENEERDHKKRRKDDQLFDSIIQLCIEDTFPYSNIYFKEDVGNVQDFECTPTKHLYTMMDIVMRVLRFDQCTRTRFQHKIHQKVKAHNASVCTRVDFQERHTRECIAQWQSDESDLRNANPANKYVRLIMASDTRHSICMKLVAYERFARTRLTDHGLTNGQLYPGVSMGPSIQSVYAPQEHCSRKRPYPSTPDL
ncbi:hypothetical protein M9434_001224 [Picochlorum sp. BPE23]|nr:hypothetical protein M9434_001224 [Picochlorum sp. BPE23]